MKLIRFLKWLYSFIVALIHSAEKIWQQNTTGKHRYHNETIDICHRYVLEGRRQKAEKQVIFIKQFQQTNPKTQKLGGKGVWNTENMYVKGNPKSKVNVGKIKVRYPENSE